MEYPSALVLRLVGPNLHVCAGQLGAGVASLQVRAPHQQDRGVCRVVGGVAFGVGAAAGRSEPLRSWFVGAFVGFGRVVGGVAFGVGAPAWSVRSCWRAVPAWPLTGAGACLGSAIDGCGRLFGLGR